MKIQIKDTQWLLRLIQLKKKLPKRKVNTQRRFHNAKCVTSIFPSIKAHWEERMQYRRQSGSSVPDSWLNFRWTLSNWRVRTNSCGTIADELSLSKLSFRLLWNRQQSKKKNGVKRWMRKSVSGLWVYADVTETSRNREQHSDKSRREAKKRKVQMLKALSHCTLWWEFVWCNLYVELNSC